MGENVKHTPAMSRELMARIVDEVFDGAIEDTRVIEEIYAVIKRHEAEPKHVRAQVEDGIAILKRLAEGDTIVFSLDGDMAWFTKGDRAFVGNAIMDLREKGYLLRKRDVVDDDDDPRGIADYDTISDAGLSALAAAESRP